MRTVEIKHGLKLFSEALVGETIIDVRSHRAAIVGEDYVGAGLTVVVDANQKVSAGQVVATHASYPEIHFCAPAHGVVTGIHRGRQRRLQSLVIEIDDAAESTSARVVAPNDAAQTRELLLAHGLWTALRNRPFDRIPGPSDTCGALLVTAIDTHPLAPDPALIIRRHEEAFATGLTKLALLTPTLYLCVGHDSGIPAPELANLVPVSFSGPHPAGLPGTHMHFLASAGGWHIGYQDVIAFGYLLLTGMAWREREITVAAVKPSSIQLVRTIAGAHLPSLVADMGIASETDAFERIVSGSLLGGRRVTPATAFLGRNHNQVTVLPPSDDEPTTTAKPVSRMKLPQFVKALLCHRSGMLPLELYDAVWPFRMPVAALLRALLNQDTELAAQLGVSMLAEEDLALCSYVCPAGLDYGTALRNTLDAIQRGD